MYLVDNIDSLRSRFLDELYTKGVIDLRDSEQLRAEQTQTSCNETLLSMLGRKSAQQFEQFLSSLTASGQDFVVKELLGDSHSTDSHTNDSADSSGEAVLLNCVINITTTCFKHCTLDFSINNNLRA